VNDQNKYVAAIVSLGYEWNEDDEPDLVITVGHETHRVRLWRSSDIDVLKRMGVPVEQVKR
jgi:hypothetical protein